MEHMEPSDEVFEEAFRQVVAQGNQIGNADPEADLWDVADGMLAGAIHYWLYTRQPCGDPRCEECAIISTAEGRVAEIQRMIRQFTEESEYYHSPNDVNVGRA